MYNKLKSQLVQMRGSSPEEERGESAERHKGCSVGCKKSISPPKKRAVASKSRSKSPEAMFRAKKRSVSPSEERKSKSPGKRGNSKLAERDPKAFQYI